MNHNTILEQISDGFFALDRSWKFTYVNKEAESFFDKGREELLENNILSLFPLAIGSKLQDDLTKAMAATTPLEFEHHGLKTGKYYMCKSYPSNEGISVYFYDITDRKRTEETLKELASIVNCSNDIIISANLEGHILSSNPATEACLGYALGDIQNRPLFSIFPPDCYKIVRAILDNIKAGDNIKNLKTTLLSKDGNLIKVLLSAFPIINSAGRVKGFSIICRDVTELRNNEKELARLDRLNLIGQMSAGISHEIRNPLTTIRGFLQLLSERQEYHHDLTYFKLMIQEIDRANSIITEFLSLGKTKAGDVKFINLNDVLFAMEPLITTQALNEDLTIKFEKNEIPLLLLDEKEIRQLILNLVRNGIEAMANVRNGYLTIKTYVENNDVVLAFVDQGPGIPEEIMKKIGTPFYSTKENGTGLGIAVCNSIVQHYQGKIHCTTSEAGTIFSVRLPIKYNNHL